MNNLKSTTLIIALGILLAGGITFATAVWQGTAWITNGATISADRLKADLDYLYERDIAQQAQIDALQNGLAGADGADGVDGASYADCSDGHLHGEIWSTFACNKVHAWSNSRTVCATGPDNRGGCTTHYQCFDGVINVTSKSGTCPPLDIWPHYFDY